MRYTTLLLLALLALATCDNLSFLSKLFVPQDSVDGAESSSDVAVEEFFTGFFSSFKLDRPDDFIRCFSDKKSRVAGSSFLYENFELFKDSTERSSFQAHFDWAKLALIYKVLEPTFGCISLSQDMTDLLDALNLTKRDPSLWSKALYLNFQAHYDDLYEAYKPVVDNLNAHNFTQAGSAFGDVLKYTVETINKEGWKLQAFNGFGNGFAVSLDIDEPSDSLECYDTNSSALTLKFLYKLSVAVTDGKFWEAPLNTLNFYENEGKAILEKLSKDVMDCDAGSDDHQSIVQALGIDNYSNEFVELFKKYVNNNRLSYYGYMKGLRSAFEDRNFIHAGNYYGNFLKAVAAKKD